MTILMASSWWTIRSPAGRSSSPSSSALEVAVDIEGHGRVVEELAPVDRVLRRAFGKRSTPLRIRGLLLRATSPALGDRRWPLTAQVTRV